MVRWALLLALAWTLAWQARAAASGPERGEKSARAVELSPGWLGFEERDLSGRRWTAADLLGRVVVLEWWTSWCLPCRDQIPELQRLHAELSSDQLVLLGVLVDRGSASSLRPVVASLGVEWPQIHQQSGFGGDLSRRFGVEAVPRTLLFDREGRLVASDLRGEHLRAAVAGLLDLEPERRDPTERDRSADDDFVTRSAAAQAKNAGNGQSSRDHHWSTLK